MMSDEGNVENEPKPTLDETNTSTDPTEGQAPEIKDASEDTTEDASKDAEKPKTLLTDAGEKENEDSKPFELKLPEGVEVDAELLGALQKTAKDADHAQQLVDVYLQVQQREREEFTTAFQKQQEQWVEEIKADKEVETLLLSARKAMDRFASPELREFLDVSGLGNHPLMVRFVAAVGQAMSEDSVAGTSGNTAPAGDTNILSKLYNHPTSKAG